MRRRGLRRRILQQPVKVLYERRDRRPPQVEVEADADGEEDAVG